MSPLPSPEFFDRPHKNYDAIDFEFNFSSRKKFLKDLLDTNFRVLSMETYDFRIPLVGVLLPNLYVRMGKLMFQKRHNLLFKGFSQGLLIKVQK